LPVASVPSAEDLPRVTVVDPAPDYRWWYVGGRPVRVRLVLSIPVKFQGQAGVADGRILVAVGHGP
jgi:hypothetical protein